MNLDEDDGLSKTETDLKVEAARHIEAILMVAEEPISAELLAQVIEMPVAYIAALLGDMQEAYETERRGFCLREVAGGWRYYSHGDEAPYVENFVRAEQNPRLSAAALETLAIVAYKQPVSRAQLSAIRGVNCDGVVRSLIVRGLIEEVARDSGPGQAVLYGTTLRFLEQMGLRQIGELADLAQFAPEPGTAELVEKTLRGDPADGVVGDAADGTGILNDGIAADNESDSNSISMPSPESESPSVDI